MKTVITKIKSFGSRWYSWKATRVMSKANNRIEKLQLSSCKYPIRDHLMLNFMTSRFIKFISEIQLDYTQDDMFTIKLSSYPFKIRSLSINPIAINKVIEANFTIFERILYKNSNLFEAAIAQIDLFIYNTVNHPNNKQIFDIMFHLASNTYDEDRDHYVSILDEYLDNLLCSTLNTKYISGEEYQFLNTLSEKHIEKILSIYSKVIRNSIHNTLSPKILSKNMLDIIKQNSH